MVMQEGGDGLLKELLHILACDRPVGMMCLAFNDQNLATTTAEAGDVHFPRSLLKGYADTDLNILPAVDTRNQGRKRFEPQRSQVLHEGMVAKALKGQRDTPNVSEVAVDTALDIGHVAQKCAHLCHQVKRLGAEDVLQVDDHEAGLPGRAIRFLCKPVGGDGAEYMRPARYSFYSCQPGPMALDIEHTTFTSQHIQEDWHRRRLLLLPGNERRQPRPAAGHKGIAAESRKANGTVWKGVAAPAQDGKPPQMLDDDTRNLRTSDQLLVVAEGETPRVAGRGQ